MEGSSGGHIPNLFITRRVSNYFYMLYTYTVFILCMCGACKSKSSVGGWWGGSKYDHLNFHSCPFIPSSSVHNSQHIHNPTTTLISLYLHFIISFSSSLLYLFLILDIDTLSPTPLFFCLQSSLLRYCHSSATKEHRKRSKSYLVLKLLSTWLKASRIDHYGWQGHFVSL